jgi:hypothetical protein
MVWRCDCRKRDSSPPPTAFFPPFFDMALVAAVRGVAAGDGVKTASKEQRRRRSEVFGG